MCGWLEEKRLVKGFPTHPRSPIFVERIESNQQLKFGWSSTGFPGLEADLWRLQQGDRCIAGEESLVGVAARVGCAAQGIAHAW